MKALATGTTFLVGIVLASLLTFWVGDAFCLSPSARFFLGVVFGVPVGLLTLIIANS